MCACYTENQEDKDRFIQALYLISEPATEALQKLLMHYLQRKRRTVEVFINNHQHAIFHLFSTKKCCQCKGHSKDFKKVLSITQMELMFNENNRFQCHGTSNGSDRFCCSKCISGIQIVNFDITLLFCLLTNFCDDLFIDYCLENKTVTQYLDENIHEIYHLFKKDKCCLGPAGCESNPDKPPPYKNWTNLFEHRKSKPRCNNSDVCSFQASKNATIDQAKLIHDKICKLKIAVTKLKDYRNTLSHSAGERKLDSPKFEAFWVNVVKQINCIATFVGEQNNFERKITEIQTSPKTAELERKYHNRLLDDARDSAVVITKLDCITENVAALTEVVCMLSQDPKPANRHTISVGRRNPRQGLEGATKRSESLTLPLEFVHQGEECNSLSLSPSLRRTPSNYSIRTENPTHCAIDFQSTCLITHNDVESTDNNLKVFSEIGKNTLEGLAASGESGDQICPFCQSTRVDIADLVIPQVAECSELEFWSPNAFGEAIKEDYIENMVTMVELCHQACQTNASIENSTHNDTSKNIEHAKTDGRIQIGNTSNKKDRLYTVELSNHAGHPNGSAGQKNDIPTFRNIKQMRTKVKIRNGDIINAKTDAIVNFFHPNSEKEQGSLSAYVLNSGGSSLKKEFALKYPSSLAENKPTVTSNGKLKCKNIIHIALPYWSNSNSMCLQRLQENLQHCFKIIRDIALLPTIALPIIGCGSLRYPPERVARAMAEEVIRNPSSPIGSVEIYAINNKDVEVCKDVFTMIGLSSLVITDNYASHDNTIHIRPFERKSINEEMPSVSSLLAQFDQNRSDNQKLAAPPSKGKVKETIKYLKWYFEKDSTKPCPKRKGYEVEKLEYKNQLTNVKFRGEDGSIWEIPMKNAYMQHD